MNFLSSSSLLKNVGRVVLSVAALAASSALIPAVGEAQAAPYCLLRKPQLFGRPANCFEFYLADLARADGGVRAGLFASTAGPACGVTAIGARERWEPDPSFPFPLPDWRSGDIAMHVTSPYHQDAYGCRLATALGLGGATPAGGAQGPATGGGWNGNAGGGWTGAGVQPPAGGAFYVYALKDIGLVVATQDTVRTRPACHWSGGGPRPCQAPASVLGAFGGPYPTEDAARNDMRTKLDCHRGYWGTFLPHGSGRFWLQNNLTASDCRSVKQL